MLVKFVKYEGAGNDFILIDDREGAFRPDAGHIAALCDRHFGIGADGLMTLRRSAGLDCSMRYYNADGSAGEMCGNGARCFALFAEHLGIGGETKYFDATDGVHTAHIRRAQGPAGEIELGMINVSEIRSGGGWWWHSVEDTMDKVDPQLLMRDTRVLVELVKEFADEAHLPFDAAGCLAQMRDTVADIRTHCGDDFDFAPVERALEELDKACAGRICFSSDRQAKEAGGRLTRLLCSACDEYHFDNTFAVGLLPGLQLVRGKHRNDLPPQEFLYWRTAFRRQVNRFVSECTSIVQALNSDADSVV